MRRMRPMLFVITTALITAIAATAQPEICPAAAALVRAAVANTTLECADVQIGEACYGSPTLETDTVANTRFNRVGHTLAIPDLLALQSAPLNIDDGEWGITVMRPQSNTPNEILTYVVFGDVSLTSTSTESEPVRTVPVRVTFDAGANVRSTPSESASLAGALTAGAIVPATGRLADGSWFRVFLDDGTSGWVRADLIRVEGDLAAIPAITPDEPAPLSLFSPMLVFQFTSGQDDSPCSSVPNSGILAQTGGVEMHLIINGIDLYLNGTVYLQAKPEGGLMVTTLEGDVRIVSAQTEEFVIPGFRSEVRWDADQLALGTPRTPLQTEFVRVLALPLSLLPRSVEPEFNLLGVVTPAAPNPLAGITAESRCTVAAVNDEVRLRIGPGRDYPVRGGLFTDQSANAEARAIGSDGAIWWRLAEGMWVRSDIVFWEGDCGALPMIDAPPLPG